MYVVCPERQWHCHDYRTVACPRCGVELDEPAAARATRSSAKARQQCKPRRDPKHTRRADRAGAEPQDL